MDQQTQTLSDISRHFSRFVAGREGSRFAAPLAALVSEAVAEGHICIDLDDFAGTTATIEGKEISFPLREELEADLLQSPLVGRPGERRPLILDGDGRLYLYRYREYERQVAEFISLRSKVASPALQNEVLREGLVRLFPLGAPPETDWQKVAALAALRRRFVVISGGPGTGKTSTVVKILALLAEQGGNLKIALAAPTGKAAARLRESIRGARENLPCAGDVKRRIPEEVSTIHRLLGYLEGSVRFRHGKNNPLSHDVVVVDEASMVSLPLMAKLMSALRPEARLILLGDRDQLASVEAGAVLGDICGESAAPPFSASFAAFATDVGGEPVEAVSGAEQLPMCDSLVVLRKTYRFGGESGIREAAELVNAGDGAGVLAKTEANCWQDLAVTPLPSAERLKEILRERVLAGYCPYLKAATPEEALRLFDTFRILCALRNGVFGVEGVNRLVTTILAEKGLIRPSERWYHGRPVLVTANDYGLKLFNGDVGIILHDPEDDAPRAFFPSADGGVKKVSPIRLPAHETAYAMTVHKSQGSEFDCVLMLLPDRDAPVVTRELVYTGITRAKRAAEIVAEAEVLVAGTARKVRRGSGLASTLWGR